MKTLIMFQRQSCWGEIMMTTVMKISIMPMMRMLMIIMCQCLLWSNHHDGATMFANVCQCLPMMRMMIMCQCLLWSCDHGGESLVANLCTTGEKADQIARGLHHSLLHHHHLLRHHQAPTSRLFWLRVGFEQGCTKKSEYRVEQRVAKSVVGNEYFVIIIIADISVIITIVVIIVKSITKTLIC